MKRLEFIDSLRGLAIALMVANHGANYLTARPISQWAYLLVYLSVTLAAPLFLFIAGFSLALSQANSPGGKKFLKYLKRGAGIILLGWLINALFYYSEPLWRGRILQTIGVGIILAYPFIQLAGKRKNRLIILAVSLFGLAIFPLCYPAMAALAATQPLISQIFLSEFPLYPWLFLLVIGLVAGQEYIERGGLARKEKIALFSLGSGLLAVWLALSLSFKRAEMLTFLSDYNLNGYWNPSNTTWLWIIGWIMVLFVIFYAVEKSKEQQVLRNTPRPAAGQELRNNNWLALMGRSALFLYFIQFFFIRTIGMSIMGLDIAGPILFIIVFLILIYLLCLSAKFRPFVSNMIFGRPNPRARIS